MKTHVRMTITCPIEVRQKMTEYEKTHPVNWSEIASHAFVGLAVGLETMLWVDLEEYNRLRKIEADMVLIGKLSYPHTQGHV